MALTLNGTTGLSGIVGSAGTPALQGSDTNTGYFFGTDTLGLSTGGSERLHIDSGGRVGIGVTPSASEGTELAIKSSDGATNIALIPNANTEFSQIGFYNATLDSTQGYIKYNNNDNSLQFRVNLGIALHINNTRNVGIGTTSPTEKLHVEGNIRIGGSSTANTAGDDLVIEGSSDRGLSIISGTSSSANIYFGDSDDTDIGRIAYQQNDNKLQFYVNEGKCGLQILNTGATELLHNGSLSAVTAANDFDVYRRLRVHADRSSGMGGHLLAIGQWDDSNHRIEGDANRPIFITAYNTGGIKMRVSGANKVAVNSHGIVFNGDTAETNALDEYEEGTWTPANSNMDSVTTYSADYVKIGKIVQISFAIAFSAAPADTAQTAWIDGLPFTSRSNATYITLDWTGTSSSLSRSASTEHVIFGSSSRITFYYPTGGHAQTRAHIAGKQVRATFTYLAAS